jgi:ATP/maltotriose-dependent transcriptional regulator MalT/DNA-binding SARP family transcriptional activator
MSNNYPLINIKIRAPQRRQNLLRRQRLVDFIHGNIHYKLILLSAGAGYGKTSLLIDYAHDTNLPVCWYSLDANDGHVPTFIEYLVATIRNRFPKFGDSILEVLRSFTGPVENVEPFVRLILHELEENIDQYFVLILDDYHQVIDSEPVNALIDGVLRYLPEHCHIILASRGIPRRLTLTRLASYQEVVGLGVSQLCFTVEEISALLEKMGQTGLTTAQVQRLAERSEGWITGILLVAQSNWTEAAQDILEISGATEGVFDYMATEILERQPAERQHFLLGSALLREMSPPLCDALLDIDGSAQILRHLSEENLFTSPLDAQGTWYQYHQLFREFLVAKFERDDPLGYRRLCLKQAEIMVYQSQWPRAIESYLSGQAFEKAVDAIEIVAQDTFHAGNWELLKKWVDALPETVAAQHPGVLLVRAKVHTETGELDQADDKVNRSYQAYTEHGDDMGAAEALVQRAVVQRFRGRLGEAMQTCYAALKMIGDQDSFTATQAHRNLGICHNMQGQISEGLLEMQRALSIAERIADDTNAAYIAHDIGTGELIGGHLISARKYYHQALLYWRKIGNPSALALTLQGLGAVHRYLGQYAEAENRLQESLSKARDMADVRIEAYTLANLGDLYHDIGQYDKSLDRYREALETTSGSQQIHLTMYLLSAMGDSYRHIDDLAHARQVLVQALDQMDESAMAYEAGLAHWAIGVLEAQQDHRKEGKEHLVRARDLFARMETPRELARTLLHLAAIAYSEGNEAEAQSLLSETTKLAGELNSHQFIVAEGPDMLDLLKYGEAHGIQGLNYVRIRTEIGQLFPSEAPKSRMHLVRPRSPLEILALNGGQVLHQGQLVSDWEAASARIMAFLFASFPSGLRRDRIIGMLWPEVDQAKGNSLFHSTIYRLRSALFKEVVVHQKGLYRINPQVVYRYDVTEFQRLAKLGLGKGGAARIARVEAIDLYHNEFLESCEHAWCHEVRQALRKRMLALLATEARQMVAKGLSQEAEALYLRILGIDSYDERAYRGMMWCKASQSDRSGAIHQFRECARILGQELDTKPSAETMNLYEAILSGHVPPPSL